ncbi:hypothetical protein GYMLUDRAFT_182569 [Collybiopsis luxurians FD-317 M1]|uniref:F-box domain-containing protein n=1 Tax=Collybiopsis luxurians FD-317 M1 TaxID=944289 RepID=A0A0D0AK81_9AGAR|nr:hypothetical protein GYMLUDRAFT_182569 [Collybiopsis luxurians FD-317 M1]
MSPHRHRRSSIRHFKISNDILLTILEFLDPPSLWRMCKAFPRVYSLAMEYQSLRYKYELAISGMKDGPVALSKVPPISRLQLLLTYRKDWLELAWTHEHRLQIPMPAQVGGSGGFIHHIHKHGVYSTLELSELPSSRKNRPPALTRHLKFTTSAIDRVAVDLSQGLIVTGSIFSYQGQIGIQLHFRDLWSFGKHPHAQALNYEFSSQISTSAAVVRMVVLVCGSKLAVSLEVSGGRFKHLILNWLNFDARWLDDQDIQFLNETYLLGVTTKSGSAIISLYNVSKVASISVVREFELPEIWCNTSMKFVPNSSPRSDLLQPSDALFYSAPETRILAITSTPAAISHSEYYPMNWLFLKESYFSFPSRRDAFRVPWRQWGQYGLAKDIDAPPEAIRGPYVVGSKVFYVENPPARSSRSHGHSRSSRLRVIDFSPFPEPAALSMGWTSVGPRAGLIPSESSRSIPSSSVDGLPVKDLCATEDNIILFLETRQGYQTVNVLTFGVPISGSSRRHR